MAEQSRVMSRALWIALAVVVVLALGATRTIMARMGNARALEASSAEQAKQYVKVATPTVGGQATTLSLPGSLQGAMQSPIAARANGYLKRWTRDIGSKVAKDELLAEIDSPEIDQQLHQVVAARQQSAASLELATSTRKRWEELRRTGMVSQQQLDERVSAEAQARANLAAADANVERLKQLEGFKRVVAPFAGVITRRNVDVGDLIDAGASRALFVLTQTDPLRVFVEVPQSYAHLVKPGQKVTVTQTELRGRKFEGTVARTSASIDSVSRTMQVEVQLPNRDGALMPGAYVQVALPLEASGATVISTNALLFRSEGLRVAAVDSAGRVTLLPVKVGRNYGPNVEVLDGLKGDERLVLNPPDSMAEGDVVMVVK
ncbi:MAG TPA: efflux RND transporter periplasmic adaptor subunit [Usitatibacter sp.]|jgi:RND family efflux transporter MFP subunit|nr:efflux RND transporter periplasmic adaptor subunit [Usitatibacter sp.]